MTVGLCLGSGNFHPAGRVSSAVSPESQVVAVSAEQVEQRMQRSHALFGKKSAAIAALTTMAAECVQADWDGNGAQAVSPEAVRLAQVFVLALPDGVPMPEFAPEPDGSISLDWIRSRHRMFSVSVGSQPRLAVAWLDGSNRGHASESFDGAKIPELILHKIQATMGTDASFRAA